MAMVDENEAIAQRIRERFDKAPVESTEALSSLGISTIGVIGGGQMGSGIGFQAARSGFTVIVCEIDAAAVEKTRARTNWLCSQSADGVEVGRKISVGCSLQDLSRVDVIIEAIVEEEQEKKKLFLALPDIIDTSKVIVASNSSGMTPSSLAAWYPHPGKVIGLHFFNPAERVPGVEVIPGVKTEPTTTVAICRLARALSKQPILIQKEAYGFFVNRVEVHYARAALVFLENGVAVADIDAAARLYGTPGPLQLIDDVGVDVAHAVFLGMADSFGQSFAPSAILSQMLRDGHLGRKSGRGFYDYQSAAESDDQLDAVREGNRSSIANTLAGAMATGIASCIRDGVVEDVDTALYALGLCMGFPDKRLADMTKRVGEKLSL